MARLCTITCEVRRQLHTPVSPNLSQILPLDGGRLGVLIGDVMVSIGHAWGPAAMATQAHDVQAELGWALRPEETGHGYATEAVEAVLRICFEDLGLRRVTASCFTTNTASWRLMERLGMRREAHTVADGLHPSGEWRDGYTYALLADEWRQRNA